MSEQERASAAERARRYRQRRREKLAQEDPVIDRFDELSQGGAGPDEDESFEPPETSTFLDHYCSALAGLKTKANISWEAINEVHTFFYDRELVI